MNYNIIGGFLTPFVSSASSILIFLMLEKNRYRRSVSFMISSLLVIGSTLSGGLIFVFLGKAYYIKTILWTLFVPAFVFEFLLSGQRNSKTVFTALTTSVIGFAGTTPVMILALYLHTGVILYDVLRIIMFGIIVLVIKYFLQKPYRKMQQEIDKGWMIFSMLPAFEVIVNYSLLSIFPGRWEVILPTSIILLIFLFAIYALFYYIFIQLHEKYDMLDRERLMLMQNHYGKLLLEQQETSIEKIKHMRHDLRHHVRTALSMIEHGNISEAARQFTEILENADNVPLMSFCDNKTANYVFSFFFDKAKKENIDLKIEAAISEECGIDPVDLGGIISNLLENAIEGCLRVTDESLKSISISCFQKEGKMLIRSENCCTPEIRFNDDMPVSSKEEGGIGTQSVIRIAEKYNGIADFSAHDRIFLAKVILHAK